MRINRHKHYENIFNIIRFIIIDIGNHWDFRSFVADDAFVVIIGLVFLQKFEELIRQTHQQQIFREIYSRLQRKQKNTFARKDILSYIALDKLDLLYFLYRHRNAVASDFIGNDSHWSYDAYFVF